MSFSVASGLGQSYLRPQAKPQDAEKKWSTPPLAETETRYEKSELYKKPNPMDQPTFVGLLERVRGLQDQKNLDKEYRGSLSKLSSADQDHEERSREVKTQEIIDTYNSKYSSYDFF
jgi:hypothetical protein